VLNGTAGPDTWTVTADAGNNSVIVNGTPVVQSNITDVQVNGSDGDDTLTVAHSTIPITFNGGNNNDKLKVGAGLMTQEVTANITFTGGAGTDTIEGHDESYTNPGNYGFVTFYFSWNYAVAQFDSTTESVSLATSPADSFSVIDSLAFPFGITINGAAGSDTVQIDLNGSSNVPTFNGGAGAGVDSLVLTDSASTSATYSVSPTVVSRTGRTVNYGGVESVQVQGVAGSANTFNVSGTGTNTLTLIGGSVSDSFNLTAAQYPTTTINGAGGALDVMTVDDRTLSSGIFRANIDPTSIARDRGTVSSFTTYNISFSGLEKWTFDANNSTTEINVKGVSSSIPSGQQATIVCGTGNDTVSLFPHDAGGNLTFNGALGVFSGAGSDTLTVNDTASSVNTNYTFSNLSGATTQNITGMGTAGFGAFNDTETIKMLGGGGVNYYYVNQWQSGIALNVQGGAGDDYVMMAYSSNDLSASVTSMSAFNYDGGGGNNQFDVFNSASAVAWTYTRTSTTLTCTKSGYSAGFPHSNVGYTFAGGGTAVDQYLVPSSPANTNFEAAGGGANDVYSIGSAGSVAGVLGYISCGRDAQGNDTVTIDNTADSTGRIVHIDPRLIGDSIGDTLFGGTGIVDIGDCRGTVTLKLGSGADTIYALPSQNTPIVIQANNPTSGSGDSLNVATAPLTNPVYNNTGGGTGNFTYVGSPGFSFTGIETVNTDNVRPTITSVDFNGTAAGQQLLVNYSEDVSRSLYYNSAYAAFQNVSSVVPRTETLSYNTATNTATFGYAALANGSYFIDVDNARDLFGNPQNTPTPTYNFVWAQGSSGNDSYRVVRNPADSKYNVFNGHPTPAFVSNANTSKIVLVTGDGDDSLETDATDGDVIPTKGIVFDAGNGAADRIDVIDTIIPDNVKFSASAINFNPDQITHTGVEKLSYDGNGGDDALQIIGNLSVTFPTTQHFSSLTIKTGSGILAPGGGKAVVVSGLLNVSSGGRLDLTDNALIVRNGSPTAVEGLVRTGFNFGDWLGVGVTSSVAAAPSSNGNYALGVALNGSLVNPFGDGTTGPLFAGQTVNASDVLVKFTHRVDLDLDGLVTGNDAAVFNGAFSEGDGGATWMSGDVDYDGFWTSNDAAFFNSFYDESLPQL
jgi:hypothetical protein